MIAYHEHHLHRDREASVALLLSSTLLLGWLFNSTQSAAATAFRSWVLPIQEPWIHNLSFPMQAILASLLTAATLALPIRHIGGRYWKILCLLVAVPYAYLEGRHHVFKVHSWIADPRLSFFHLFDILAPPLVLVAMCASYSRAILGTILDTPDGRLVRSCQRYWRGEISTPPEYLGLFTIAACFLAAGIYERNMHTVKWLGSAWGSSIYILVFVIPASFFSISLVGTWRSLSTLERRPGIAAGLAELGQIVVLLMSAPLIWMSIITEIPMTSVAFQQGVRLVPGRPWDVIVAGQVLLINGEFTTGIGRVVEVAIRDHPQVRVVTLNSPGGDKREGDRIAAAVGANSLSTSVEQECASACTDVFIAGRERALLPNAVLGFHACRALVWNTRCENSAWDNFAKAGVAPEFIREVSTVPSEKMWFPTIKELVEAHVVTRVTPLTLKVDVAS